MGSTQPLQQRQSYYGQQASPPPQEAEETASGEALDCPECGAELVDMSHRRKHAYGHYGNGDIPNFPNTRLARERYAELVNEPVRGN